MSLRAPKAYSPRPSEDPISAALDQEILTEKVSTYARLMECLEQALAALADFDAAVDTHKPHGEEGAQAPVSNHEQPGTASLPRADPSRRRSAPPQDEACAGAEPDPRANLLARAGEALWHVVIQRELMRLPGTERLLKEMKVPAELRLRMGVIRRR